jgi:hypothetical protein
MSADIALADRLIDQNVAGGRVRPMLADDDVYPAVGYELVDDDRHNDLVSHGTGGMALVRLECWATSYAAARELAAACSTALCVDWDGSAAGVSSCSRQSSRFAGRVQLEGRRGWYWVFEQEYLLGYSDPSES